MSPEDDFKGGLPAAPAPVVAPSGAEAPDGEFDDFEQEDDSGSIFGLRPPGNRPTHPSPPGKESSREPEPVAPLPVTKAPPPGLSLSLPATAIAPDAYEPEEEAPVFGFELEQEPVHDLLSELSAFETLDRQPSDFLPDLPAEPDSFANSCFAGEAESLPFSPDLPVEAEAPLLPDEPAEKEGRWLGIRFRKAGQVYFYPDEEHTVRNGTKVLVQLESGSSLGAVESIIYGNEALSRQGDSEQGKVLGLATAQDIARHAENSILGAEAEAFCKTCIRQRNLDMKLVDVEVLHDRSKIIFFFTAPTRIDFRELVKDLVRNYRTRIELRQIGVRHESQMIGGLGNCGMVCCCHRYLRKFAPVTIKMAKEQNLFLNPAKLSGMCGRLLCCLSFEQGNYEEFNRRCPKIGKRYVTSAKGTVKILRANMFSQSIALLSDSGEEFEVSLEEWEVMQPRRAEPQQTEQSGSQRVAEDGPRKYRHRDHAHSGFEHDETALSHLENGNEHAVSRRKETRQHPRSGRAQKRGRQGE